MSKVVGIERYGSTSLSNSYLLSPDDKRLELVCAKNYRFLSLSQFFRVSNLKNVK